MVTVTSSGTVTPTALHGWDFTHWLEKTVATARRRGEGLVTPAGSGGTPGPGCSLPAGPPRSADVILSYPAHLLGGLANAGNWNRDITWADDPRQAPAPHTRLRFIADWTCLSGLQTWPEAFGKIYISEGQTEKLQVYRVNVLRKGRPGA